MASESKRSHPIPPPPPESRKEVVVRNTIIISGCIVIGYVFLKPWDGESVLGHLDAPKPPTDAQKTDP